jgi:hypothetical protein
MAFISKAVCATRTVLASAHSMLIFFACLSFQLRRTARPTAAHAARPFATQGQYEIIDHQYDVCVVGAGGKYRRF